MSHNRKHSGGYNQKRIYLGLPVEELDLMYGGNERGGDMDMDKDDMDWETYFFQI